MGRRAVIFVFALLAAAITAIVFGFIAHDDLGIAAETIRTDALVSAGFIYLALATERLLRRNK
jgi:uncharacterized membrane protein